MDEWHQGFLWTGKEASHQASMHFLSLLAQGLPQVATGYFSFVNKKTEHQGTFLVTKPEFEPKSLDSVHFVLVPAS